MRTELNKTITEKIKCNSLFIITWRVGDSY